jgi:hypothetical protein
MALGFYKHTQHKERRRLREKKETKRKKLKVFLSEKYGMIWK